MKKQLIAIVLSIVSFGVYSQTSSIWQAYGSDLPANWGIRYLSAVDSNTVWAIGFYKSPYAATNVFTTTSNGGTFTAGIFLPDTNTFNASSICALNADTAFISLFDKAGDGTSGQILQTTNGGSTWVNIAATGTTDTTGMFLGANNFPDFVYFWNANNGIAVGDPNGNTIYSQYSDTLHGDTVPQFEIWQTINGGTNWTRVSDTMIPYPQTNEYGVSSSYAVYAQKIWFGTTTGRVYSSIDSGRWVAYPTGLYGGANGLAFRDSLNGIVWGFVNDYTQTTTVLNTTDGGQTWTSLNLSAYIGKTDFCNIPGANSYMSVGLDGANTSYATSITQDDGLNWTLLESSTSNIEQISVVQMLDTMHGWAGTPTTNATNGMNKYIGAKITGIKQVASNNNQILVYPNPSNGYITLSLTNVTTTTALSVCDMLGNEVYTTTIKGSASNQNLNIDLSAMQKGMYMLKMQSSTNTNQVQKLIIQ